MTKSDYKWEFYQDTKKEWRWKTFAKNGTQIGASSEGYTTKQNCINGITSVKAHAPYDMYYDRKDGFNNYTFNLKSSNGEVIGRSENYTSRMARENGIDAVKRDAPVALIEDLTL